MKRAFAIIVAASSLLAHSRVWACATCFGDPNDPQTQGMNSAILTLLGVTYGLFFVMFVAGFVIWRRNQRVVAQAGAGVEALSDSPDPQSSAKEPLHG